MMGSHEDDLLFDDEADDFLDAEDPGDAIRVRNSHCKSTIPPFALLTIFPPPARTTSIEQENQGVRIEEVR